MKIKFVVFLLSIFSHSVAYAANCGYVCTPTDYGALLTATDGSGETIGFPCPDGYPKADCDIFNNNCDTNFCFRECSDGTRAYSPNVCPVTGPSDCANGQYWDAETRTCNDCPAGFTGGQYVAPNINGCLSSGTYYYDFGNPDKYHDRYSAIKANGCKTNDCFAITEGLCAISFLYDGQSDVLKNIMVCGRNHTSVPEPVVLEPAKCLDASENYYIGEMGPVACPRQYPLSDGGGIDACGCYRESTRTGQQIEPAMPSGCKSQTVSTCTPGGTCSYRDYQCGDDGSCSTDCTRQRTSVTAESGFYVDNLSCTACPSDYSSPDGNTGGQTSCYKECALACTQSDCPENATCTYDEISTTGAQYYGDNLCTGNAPICPITEYTCNAGYNKTYNGNCAQICTAGITKLNSSTGVVVPLFETANTVPAIHIRNQNGTCHADLIPGTTTNAIHIRYNGQTYHTVN